MARVSGPFLFLWFNRAMSGGTIFIKGESGLYRLHPLTKLVFVLFLLTCAATLPDLTWLLAVFLFLLVPLSLWGGLIVPFVKSVSTLMIPFLISLSLIQGFFTDGSTVLFSIGRFAFTLEGLLSGLTVAGRLLVALSAALLLMQSTRPDHLMLALTQRGLSNNLAYIVLSVLQIFPRFQQRAETILDAQQARGLETKVNMVGRAKLLVPLVGPLVLSSIVDVEERAMALEARAFSCPGAKTSFITLADSSVERALRYLLLFAALALVAWRVTSWL
jgi:energy-coupling factor transport system permease protein